jgi:hypothetical protein
MVINCFDALLTFDKNLQYQQNFSKCSLPVLVLVALDSTYLSLSAMVSTIKIVSQLDLQPGAYLVEN